MLRPEYFYSKTDTIISYYQQFEDYLLNDIAKFLLNSNKIGGKADRELYILNQMGMNDRKVVAELSRLTKKSRNEVRRLLQDSVMTSFSNDRAVLERLGEIIPPLQNDKVVKVINAEWVKTQGELNNLTRTTMNAYQGKLIDSMNEVALLTEGGAMGYDEACCKVIDEFGKTGLVIDYPTGARRTLEAAVRCAVVTSMNQTAAQVTNEYIVEAGAEYVLVSAHMGARHSDKGGVYSHDEWQGKAYKIRGSAKGFPNLCDSTGYDILSDGTGVVVNPHGLHGYNCRHSHQPWFPDLKNPWQDPKNKIDLEKSRERYDNEQTQRGMERSIRQTKRRLLAKQAEIDNVKDDDILLLDLHQQYDKLAYRLSKQQKEYNAFSENVGLPTQSARLKTAGFGKDESSKARGRARAYGNDLEKEAQKASALSEEMRQANTARRKERAAMRQNVVPAESKIENSLMKNYQEHIDLNNLNKVPLSEFDDSEKKQYFGVNLEKLGDDITQPIADQLEVLMNEYDTPLKKIRLMSKEEYTFMPNTLAFTEKSYETDFAEIAISPKAKNIEKIKEHIERGWFPSIKPEYADKYTITHEFAHTLLDTEYHLNDKRNWVNMDYDKIRRARKELNTVYDDYMKAFKALDEKQKAAELEALSSFDEVAWKKAVEITEELKDLQISKYALTSADEFMAECFTAEKLGGKTNKYSNSVMEIINKYFKKGK